MSQEWEQGNAAREISYADSRNPYQPLDYAARLKNAGKRPTSAASGMSYEPGQLYGRAPSHGTPLPIDASPAPMAAPERELPSYLHPQSGAPSAEPVWEEPQAYQPDPFFPVSDARPGALYSADLFSHQPTAIMPSGYDDTPFANRTPQEMDFFAELPPWPADEEPADPPPAQEDPFVDDMLEDRPWRDPFTPAAPREDKPAKSAAPKSKRRRRSSPNRRSRRCA